MSDNDAPKPFRHRLTESAEVGGCGMLLGIPALLLIGGILGVFLEDRLAHFIRIPLDQALLPAVGAGAVAGFFLFAIFGGESGTRWIFALGLVPCVLGYAHWREGEDERARAQYNAAVDDVTRTFNATLPARLEVLRVKADALAAARQAVKDIHALPEPKSTPKLERAALQGRPILIFKGEPSDNSDITWRSTGHLVLEDAGAEGLALEFRAVATGLRPYRELLAARVDKRLPPAFTIGPKLELIGSRPVPHGQISLLAPGSIYGDEMRAFWTGPGLPEGFQAPERWTFIVLRTKEYKTSFGTYTDGARAYSLHLKAWFFTWPEKRLIGYLHQSRRPPSSKYGGGSRVGSASSVRSSMVRALHKITGDSELLLAYNVNKPLFPECVRGDPLKPKRKKPTRFR